MSDDDMRTPARKRFDDVLDGIVAEAIENERDRCLSVVVKAKMAAAKKARYAVASSLRECEHAIRTTGSGSQPPASEPMTIAKVMDWLNSTGCGELKLSEVERKLIITRPAARDKGFKEGESKQMADKAPPAPEPMTVERLMEILQSRHVANGFCDSDWPDVRAELTALVQAQARRDAEMLRDLEDAIKSAEWATPAHALRKCREYHDEILKSAGLE